MAVIDNLKSGGHFDLTSIRPVKKILKLRLFQPLINLISLLVFTVLIWAGFVGTPVGGTNVAIILVWIFWFALLAGLLIPFGGRLWCMACPLPSLGEWISRRGIVKKGSGPHSFGIKWPAKLRNIWLQDFGFLIVASFSPIILTRPAATSIMLVIFIVLVIALSVTFTSKGRGGRIWCRYVCPLGGFIGLYGLVGAVEVKSKDKEQCHRCREKACSVGTKNSYACPWFEYPGGMDRNIYCGMCTECLKACPHDNISWRTRIFGQDLLKKREMDEAFKSFIMLGGGLLFAVIFLGWWGHLKDIADPLASTMLSWSINWGHWILYILIVWGFILAVIPGVHLFFSWLTKLFVRAKEVPLKKLFVDYAYALVPLGLMVWIGFCVDLVMINGSDIVSSISDPLGWGWNLFGTANYPWQPYGSGAVPHIQLVLFLVGLAGSSYAGWKLSLDNFKSVDKALKAMIPMGIFLVGLTLAFMYVFAIF